MFPPVNRKIQPQTRKAANFKPKDRAKSAKELSLGLSPSPASRTSRDLLQWFRTHARDLPWRHTRDPYAIWVSEIMLQQTQVKTVIHYWERWMRELPDVRALAAAQPEKILKLWEGLGYYTRVRNLHKAAQVVVAEHRGRFPTTFDEILALPGVGRYTAGAICSLAFNQPAPVLDGNVIRVLTRLFGIHENPKDKSTNQRLWQLAETLVQAAAKLPPRKGPFASAGNCSSLNQGLMELGALICTPRQPQCEVCPLRPMCAARMTGAWETLPNLGATAGVAQRRFAAFAIERHGRFLVQRRPAGVINAHLWEFPNVELSGGEDVRSAARRLGVSHSPARPFCVVKHSITRYRVTLEAFRARRAGRRGGSEAQSRWLSLAELEALPFSAAHRRILRTLASTSAERAASLYRK